MRRSEPGVTIEVPLSGPGDAPARGRFLVLEGVEGAGKTTQGRLLVEWLRSEGVEVVHAREPGGTPVGEAIREILLDRQGLGVPAETELLLMLAARAAFVRDVVRPAIDAGKLMVADRYEYSTFAYQGIGRGLGLERVRALNDFATGGLRPDLVLVFDIPVAVGRERQRAAGKVDDRIEGEGGAFLERVRGGYRTLVAEDPRAELVDGGGDADRIQRLLRGRLRDRFPELFAAGRG